MSRNSDPRAPRPIERRFARLLSPLQRFSSAQTVTSSLLLGCAVLALVIGNSGWAEGYEDLLHTPVGLYVGDWRLELSLRHWVNDGLMALFFFLLGLEIKRELIAGELQDPARARLLVITALGGMVAPALVYAAVAPADALRGWGIPMATDTAFAIGVLALLGDRVPRGLAAFLIGLAIVDDIGAVLVIAAFYTQSIDGFALAAAAILLGVLIGLNRLGVRRPLPYLLIGAGLWYAVLRSGVHATVAGVLAAATVPARTGVSRERFEERIRALSQRLRSRRRRHRDILSDPSQHAIVDAVRAEAEQATTPLQRWETALETPIALLVLPIFALANAGISLQGGASMFTDRLVLAILIALPLGKLIGITGFCYAGRRLGLGTLPAGIDMRHVAGMSLVAGMGFTMSIFIANLAFGDAALLDRAKAGVLSGTLLAGLIGYVTLRRAGPEPRGG